MSGVESKSNTFITESTTPLTTTDVVSNIVDPIKSVGLILLSPSDKNK